VYALVANFSYIWIGLKGKLKLAGASVAHIGFALSLIGILISSSRKAVLSENTTGIALMQKSKEYDPAENITLFKGVKTDMGKYDVLYTRDTLNESNHKKYFELQTRKTPVSKNETVTAGIFKTASGWQDEKFYLLIDGVPPGSIIKITNPANNKVIYAKVLGVMSGIRQNEGLNIRISNAAAAALEIAEQDKFIVQLRY
jgi:hypothetical protein